jgi:hypothetical protein
MIEALESGADAIFMPGGMGPCRFGYYDAIQEQILKGLGYRFTMGSAENPDRLSDMLDLMKQIAGLRTRGALLKLFYLILMRLSVLDWALKRYFSIKPREAIPNETDRVFRESVQLIDSSLSFPSLLGARLRASGWFRILSQPSWREAEGFGMVSENCAATRHHPPPDRHYRGTIYGLGTFGEHGNRYAIDP